jgi:copper ion binding protein
MMKKILSIEGMSCQHCVKHVKEALKKISGVKSVQVNLEGKYAEVDLLNEISEDIFRTVIDEAGYSLVKVTGA